jgi:Holliday junction DNA helicase RuvB
MDERLLSPQESGEETLENAEQGLRPQTLKDFIGQEKARQNLSTFIAAARQRRESLDHVLLYGPPGLGKTTLAQIVAKEMGVGFRATSGPVIVRAGDLAALLTNLQPHDVLFIDEIHRLSPSVEEILYPAMEDFKLDLMIGEGPSARSVQIDLPPFTLVGATTRSGLITRPLRERFGIPTPLSFYTPEELKSVVQRAAVLLDLALTEEGALEISKRSRGTPRIALRLLRRVRDIATMRNQIPVDRQAADTALLQLEVDGQGFDAMDRRYLKVIAENYQGGPVGVETMAAVLSEEKDVVEEVVEPYLIQQGFIQRTPRGRLLTLKAFSYLGMEAPQSFGQQVLLTESDVEDDNV